MDDSAWYECTCWFVLVILDEGGLVEVNQRSKPFGPSSTPSTDGTTTVMFSSSRETTKSLKI